MARRTIIEELGDTTFRFHGLLIPVRAAHSSLARYTRQLFASNDGDDFPVSLVGSCMPVRYRARCLVLCSRHQLRGWELERISLLRADGQKLVTSGGIRHFVGVNDTDFHDLAAFDFTEPCLEGALPQGYFFELAEFPPTVQSDQIVFFICSGYPTEKQNYDVQDKRHIGLVRRAVPCTLDGPDQPADEALLRIRPLEALNFDPDGMSGGPGFVVQLVEGEFRAYFAGIMTRAGPEHVYIVRAGFVR